MSGPKYINSFDVNNHEQNSILIHYTLVYPIVSYLVIRKTLLGICSISSSFLVPPSFFTFSWPRWETQEITSHLHDLHSRPPRDFEDIHKNKKHLLLRVETKSNFNISRRRQEISAPSDFFCYLETFPWLSPGINTFFDHVIRILFLRIGPSSICERVWPFETSC